MVCQAMCYLGDGSKNLDGSGGDFEFTLQFGSQVNQPNPQIIYFSTATRTSVFTEQFPLYTGETVYVKIKSPNAGDTDVNVRVCLVEVGVESIRDDIEVIDANVDTILERIGSNTTNVFDGSSSSGHANSSGTTTIPSRC